MTYHAGQIVFSGRRVDAYDVDATAAAPRKAEEEIALSRAFVEVVGQLPLYVTGTQYAVTPIVGLLYLGFRVQANPQEVAHRHHLQV